MWLLYDTVVKVSLDGLHQPGLMHIFDLHVKTPLWKQKIGSGQGEGVSLERDKQTCSVSKLQGVCTNHHKCACEKVNKTSVKIFLITLGANLSQKIR